MRVNIYGVPANVLVRWILRFTFSKENVLWVDAACGNGNFTREIGFIPEKGIGVDIVEITPALPQNFIFSKKTISDWIGENTGRKFDVISSFEFVEHVEKKDANCFITNVKKMARLVIFSTPSGFLKQDAETDKSLENNPWLWHRCGFSPDEFEKLGFVVFILKNAHHRPKGNEKSFDKLIVYWGENKTSMRSVAWKVTIMSFLYNLIPIHLYRTIRDTFFLPFV